MEVCINVMLCDLFLMLLFSIMVLRLSFLVLVIVVCSDCWVVVIMVVVIWVRCGLLGLGVFFLVVLRCLIVVVGLEMLYLLRIVRVLVKVVGLVMVGLEVIIEGLLLGMFEIISEMICVGV